MNSQPFDADAWLMSLDLFGIRPGLKRMQRLLAALGNPQNQLDAIHVVGSNGKSSTARFVANLLHQTGLKVAAYTSPHFVEFRERLEINGQVVPSEVFSEAAERVYAAASLIEQGTFENEQITQFEAMTATAFVAMNICDVQVVALEAGLGGRWDATNVLPNSQPSGRMSTTVLTSISLEHTQWLGDTLSLIAGEKVAVVKENGALVASGQLASEVNELLLEACSDKHAELTFVTERAEGLGDILPEFQLSNLGLAKAAVERYLGAELSKDSLFKAAQTTRILGRFEKVAEHPTVIFDGAHNVESAEALVNAVTTSDVLSKPLVLLFSTLAEKDPEQVLSALRPIADYVVLTSFDHSRAANLQQLELAANEQFAISQIILANDPHEALQKAVTIAGQSGAVLVTGSLHLIASLKRGRQAGRGPSY